MRVLDQAEDRLCCEAGLVRLLYAVANPHERKTISVDFALKLVKPIFTVAVSFLWHACCCRDAIASTMVNILFPRSHQLTTPPTTPPTHTDVFLISGRPWPKHPICPKTNEQQPQDVQEARKARKWAMGNETMEASRHSRRSATPLTCWRRWWEKMSLADQESLDTSHGETRSESIACHLL
jgi:hypothetical protein